MKERTGCSIWVSKQARDYIRQKAKEEGLTSAEYIDIKCFGKLVGAKKVGRPYKERKDDENS